MDKFLELVAEEIEFSANEILKDMQNKKRRPARLTHCPLEMCQRFPDQEKSSVKRGYFDQWGYFNHTNFITAIPQKQIIKLNQIYLYDIQYDHI